MDNPLIMTKKNRRITDATWGRAREDWMSSDDSIATIASRHGMSASSLSRRAKSHGWPSRDPTDPVTIARRLYADITDALRLSLRSLQDGEDARATASERGPLIRAHRRALIALLDARKPLKSASGSSSATAPDSASYPALDMEAARKDILARLARLDRNPLPDPSRPAPDPSREAGSPS